MKIISKLFVCLILLVFILQINALDNQYLKHKDHNQQLLFNSNLATKNSNTTNTNKNNTQNQQTQNKNGSGSSKEDKAIWGTVLLFTIIGLAIVGFLVWRHKAHGQEMIDQIQMNPEMQIQQQTLNKEQQQKLEQYKFQAKDKNCKVFSAVEEEDEENTNKSNNNLDNEEGQANQEKDSCFIVEFQGASKFKGQKQVNKEKSKNKNSDFIYFEVEILELPNPNTKISVGYQIEEDYNKNKAIATKNSNHSISFDSTGNVRYYSSKNKTGIPTIYDYKRNQISTDKLFTQNELHAYLQNNITQLQLSSNFHQQKNPADLAVLILKNSAVKINPNKNGFKENTVIGHVMNRQDNYNFEFVIDNVKNKEQGETLKLGICANLNWVIPMHIDKMIQTRFVIDSNGLLEYPEFYLTKAQELQYMGIIKDFKQKFQYEYQEDLEKDSYYKELFENQSQEQKGFNGDKYQFNHRTYQYPNFKFKSGQTIKGNFESNSNILTLTLDKGQNKQNVTIKIPVPSYFRQVTQCITLKHDRDQVTLQNCTSTPQKLGYGEIIGIGIQKSLGRVWLSMNGQFLNKPTQQDIALMESKQSNKKKEQKKKKITLNPEKNKKNEDDIDEMDPELEDAINKELEKRKIKIVPEKIKDLVPVIQASGACKLNINIGGKPFRLHQDNIKYGFL